MRQQVFTRTSPTHEAICKGQLNRDLSLLDNPEHKRDPEHENSYSRHNDSR